MENQNEQNVSVSHQSDISGVTLGSNNNQIQQKPARAYLFLATLIFLLVLTGVFGVWYFSNPLPEEETGTATVANTFSNWKTYRNDEYGFEFKYPETYFLKEFPDMFHNIKINSLDFQIEGDESVDISISTHASSSIIKNWKSGIVSDLKEEYISVGNTRALRITGTLGDNVFGGGDKHGFVFINNNGNSITIDYDASSTEVSKVVEKILSTFKFISPKASTTIETTGWKTYTNNNLGFTIHIPTDTFFGPVEIQEDGGVVSLQPQKLNGIKGKIPFKATEREQKYGSSWIIAVKKIFPEQISQFVKDRYGKDCEFEIKKLPNSQESDIFVTSFYPPDESKKDCFVNYVTVMKYNQDLHKLAVWDIGQDSTFRSEESVVPPVVYDDMMADSFKFTK